MQRKLCRTQRKPGNSLPWRKEPCRQSVTAEKGRYALQSVRARNEARLSNFTIYRQDSPGMCIYSRLAKKINISGPGEERRPLEWFHERNLKMLQDAVDAVGRFFGDELRYRLKAMPPVLLTYKRDCQDENLPDPAHDMKSLLMEMGFFKNAGAGMWPGQYLPNSNAITVMADSSYLWKYVIFHELHHYSSSLMGGHNVHWMDGNDLVEAGYVGWQQEGMADIYANKLAYMQCQPASCRGFYAYGLFARTLDLLTYLAGPQGNQGERRDPAAQQCRQKKADIVPHCSIRRTIGSSGVCLIRSPTSQIEPQQVAGYPTQFGNEEMKLAFLSGNFTRVRRNVDSELGAGTFDALFLSVNPVQAWRLLRKKINVSFTRERKRLLEDFLCTENGPLWNGRP